MAEVKNPSSPPPPAPNPASASTPTSSPNGVARTAPAGKKADEERNRTSGVTTEPATTPRPSADANSPGAAAAQQQKKRKYEEATEEEKNALNSYHLSNPQLKQVNLPSPSSPDDRTPARKSIYTRPAEGTRRMVQEPVREVHQPVDRLPQPQKV